jgi:hypothetical protein
MKEVSAKDRSTGTGKASRPSQGAKRVSRANRAAAKSSSTFGADALEYGRNNALISSLVALGAGIGLGCLYASTRGKKEAKGFLPAMAGAVTHAVREAGAVTQAVREAVGARR